MAKELSVAPKERINVKFVPATGGQQEEIELPMKMVVLGDFTGKPDDTPLEDRKAIDVDKNSFAKVMKEMNLETTVEVKNVLVDDPEATLRATLKFEALQDFSPDSVAQQVPDLKKLLDLREALTALKGPLGNMPAFRKSLAEILENPDQRKQLFEQLGSNFSEEGNE